MNAVAREPCGPLPGRRSVGLFGFFPFSVLPIPGLNVTVTPKPLNAAGDELLAVAGIESVRATGRSAPYWMW